MIEDRELDTRLRALPREVAPSRDLWPGVAERIALETAGREGGFLPRRRLARVAGLLAAAALIVVAVGVALRWWPGDARQKEGRAVPAALQAAQEEWDRAKQTLEALLAERGRSLPADIVGDLRGNLAVLDRSFAALRSALLEQADDSPSRADCTGLLVMLQQRQVDLLHAAMALH